MMTTFYTFTDDHHPIADQVYNGSTTTPFDIGASHVDPEKAIDPGLIYNISWEEYTNYLCTLYRLPQI
ncbi:hypothetical protein SUGI_0820170 [Cryptomeria japonica]|nr:hypothetical protein SUGI_0820170 [Cryptomeria japonica]